MKKLLAGIAIGALGLSLVGGINLNVNPAVNLDQVLNPYQITTHFQWVGEHYDINLGNTLGDADSVQPVLTLLQNAGHNDTITFHIKGYGGDVDGMFALINAINSSKAHVLMSVEGNSYSAYAGLATSAGTLHIDKYALLMFHMGSINGVDCNTVTGMFDGIPAAVSCQNDKNAYVTELTTMINNDRILTASEKQSILAGNELYLTSAQVQARIL
jgi:ATP-dependent protease ClpP protease subunit